MSTSLFIDKFRGCFFGLAAGDALGMPVEMMTPEEIVAATGGRGVTGYLEPLQTRIKGTRGLPAGSTTDDTQLSLAVARSLIRRRGFDLDDQAREFVAESEMTTFGWGRATSRGAEELKRWFDSGGAAGLRSIGASAGAAGRSPAVPAPEPAKSGEGCGNGVAMKIAPLALFRAVMHGVGAEPFVSEVMALGLLTHGDPRASFAAAVLGFALAEVLRSNGWPRYEFQSKQLQEALVDRARLLEERYKHLRPRPEALSSKLIIAWQLLHSAEHLRTVVGTGCNALESVPFAIATFLRHPADFRAGVLEAVNAGGDADSTGSMVGALIGANVGLSGIPPEFVNGLRYPDQIVGTADALAKAAGVW